MKNQLVIGFLVGTAVLSGCTKTLTPNEQLAQRGEKEVADTLKDPTSAKFKDVVSSAKLGCIYGKILAKNSMGAYTGYHNFVWVDGIAYINADRDEILDKTDYLHQMSDYMEASGKCLGALIKESEPDAQSHIPDT